MTHHCPACGENYYLHELPFEGNESEIMMQCAICDAKFSIGMRGTDGPIGQDTKPPTGAAADDPNNQPCPMCNGIGLVHVVVIEGLITIKRPCSTCGGYGFIADWMV